LINQPFHIAADGFWGVWRGIAVTEEELMKDDHSSGLTIVGGRPDDDGQAASAISPGLRALLERLAEKPQLARDLVLDPAAALAAEKLTLAPAELAMLRHLDVEDFAQTRSMTRGVSRGAMAKRVSSEVTEERRRRLAAQLELVAPFVGEPGFYIGERTRGIRPQSIYPTPFAVGEALLRTSEDFRAAFLADSQKAILTWPNLPLSDEERRMLLIEPVIRRLEHVARNV
jgi:hypothetical protein